MDKAIFDFEKNEFTLISDLGEVHQEFPGLRDKKADILSAAGIIQIDLSDMHNLLEDLMNGVIDQEEFIDKTRELISDCIKSEFHNSLN